MAERTAFIDGPFDPSLKPWMLSYQRQRGIAVQLNLGGGVWSQPHGYLRGTKPTGDAQPLMDPSHPSQISLIGVANGGETYDGPTSMLPKKRK